MNIRVEKLLDSFQDFTFKITQFIVNGNHVLVKLLSQFDLYANILNFW